MDSEIPEFMLAVKNGMTYHFAFIKIDLERKGRSNQEYFDSVRLSFPNRETVNLMISKYRQDSAKTLYTALTSQELQENFDRRPDLLFGMIYENSWKYLIRSEVEKDGEV